jgi:hypothetical protein
MQKNIFKVNGWMGINNVLDPIDLQLAEGGTLELVEANDVNIDNRLALITRDGTDAKVTLTRTHSLWSNGKVCFIHDNGSIKEVLVDYTTRTLKAGLDLNARISYADTRSGRIFMSNGVWIGYYQDGDIYNLADTFDTYKNKMPAGQVLCYYNGRLYVAVEKFIYVSDAMKFNQYDVRTGVVVMNEQVVMMAPVDDGIYVGAGDVSFLGGPNHLNFQRRVIADFNAIPNSQADVTLSMVGDGQPGTGVFFCTEQGIYLGLPGGNATNMTNDRYQPMSGFWCSAVVRPQDNYYQYLTTIQS